MERDRLDDDIALYETAIRDAERDYAAAEKAREKAEQDAARAQKMARDARVRLSELYTQKLRRLGAALDA